jgi:hypothetical protein
MVTARVCNGDFIHENENMLGGARVWVCREFVSTDNGRRGRSSLCPRPRRPSDPATVSGN